MLVIERDAQVFPLPRAAHIDHQGLRLLQEIACLDGLLPKMITNPGIDFVTASGELMLRIPGDVPSASGLPASKFFFQPTFDRQVRTAAAAFPSVDVLVDTEMTDLEQDADCVRLGLRLPDGTTDSIEASWVVGCDGAWSSVREMVGSLLEDLGFHERWLVIDLILKRKMSRLPDHAVTVCDPARPATLIPIPDGRFRFELQVMPGDGDATAIQNPDRMLALLSPWVGGDDVEVERSAVYNFHGLVAHPWRVGRVFVAGDAAHQMPPFLGQGMCSGLRDATNLAWKLDQVVRQGASSGLLDTYEQERRPHVSGVVRAAVEYGRITCETDPVLAAERDRRLLTDSRPATHRLAFSLPNLEQGPLVRAGGGELFLQPVPAGSEPRLDDVVGQQFLVAYLSGADLGRCAGWWADEVGALVASVDDLPGAAQIRAWLRQRHGELVIVRPDRYVMAVGRSLDEITESLPRELLAPDLTHLKEVNRAETARVQRVL